MRALLPLAAFSMLALGAMPEPGGRAVRSSTPLGKIQPYRSWHCTTPVPVDMSPSMALSCIGPARWDSDPVNPHVPRLYKIFVNPTGKKAMLSDKPMAFPVGSIIVKEKFAVDPPRARFDISPRKVALGAKPELLTVMVKREKGYDVANGDWEYLVLSGDAKRETSDGLQHCAKCHLTAKERDFVWTRSLDKPYPPRWGSAGGMFVPK